MSMQKCPRVIQIDHYHAIQQGKPIASTPARRYTVGASSRLSSHAISHSSSAVSQRLFESLV